MAEIRIEEKKRGAPWLLIIVLLVVAAIIGTIIYLAQRPGPSIFR